ncbi:hypothetical protein Btru_034227 [Bulinus truncatus]|nr:hypothetical protein Btru_034227 [Bulinus truncatus]
MASSDHLNISQGAQKALYDALNSKTIEDALKFYSEIRQFPNAVSVESLNEALLLSCDSGNTILAQILLSCRTDINCRDTAGNTPLMICAKNGFCDLAELLLHKKPKICTLNNNGDSALILSVTKSGSSELTRLLLRENGIDKYHKNQQGYTFFMKAVEFMDIDVITMVLWSFKFGSLKSDGQLCQELISDAEHLINILSLPKIFVYLKQDILENKPALVSAASESDFVCVNLLMTSDFSKKYSYGDLITSILAAYVERGQGVSETDIIKKKSFKESIVPIVLSLIHLLFTLQCKCNLLDVFMEYVPDVLTIYDDEILNMPKAFELGALDFIQKIVKMKEKEKVIDVRKCLEKSIEFERLIDLGADVNGLFNGLSPLMFCKDVEIAKSLISKGADVHYKAPPTNMNIIHVLNTRRNVQKIIDTSNGVVNQASLHKYKELIIYYQSIGVSLDESHYNGQTVLMMTAGEMDLEFIVEFLLVCGADPNRCDEFGQTALHYAVSNNRAENVNILLQFNTDVNTVPHNKQSCLHSAVQKSKLPILKLLLQYGADANIRDRLHQRPLTSATADLESDCDVIQELINAGAVVDGTSLMAAVRARRTETIVLLCNNGALRHNYENVVGSVADMLRSQSYIYWTEESLNICMEYLLAMGARTEEIPFHYISKLISKDELDLLKIVIQQGLSPREYWDDEKFITGDESEIISTFSFALLNDKVETAKYLSDICFLTLDDLFFKIRKEKICAYLEEKGFHNSLSFFDKFYSRPVTLEKLCLLTISSSFPLGCQREIAVQSLPIPTELKDKLVFKYATYQATELKNSVQELEAQLLQLQ